jgi:energy-coupling factor transporter ATP-binding protein EcfA2
VLDTAGTPIGDYYGLPDLSPEQAAAVTHLATQPARLRVLEGPAGSGKTTTLRSLAVLWQARAGPGTVIGLAPSASAAATLQAPLGVPCENTTKWLHETTGPAGQQRAALAAQLLTAPAGRAVRGPLLRDVLAEQSRWALPPTGLLIVDEASLADTHTLATLTAQAQAAHTVILLVGDPHQGGSVGAGGAFGLLARHTHHAELAALHCYHHTWEAHATLGLRHGHPDALPPGAAHDRLHTAPPAHPPTPSATCCSTRPTKRGPGRHRRRTPRPTARRRHDHRHRAERPGPHPPPRPRPGQRPRRTPA